MKAKKIDLQDTFTSTYGDIGNAPGESQKTMTPEEEAEAFLRGGL